MERPVRGEPARHRHHATEEDLVEEALLEPVGQLREFGQVAEDPDGVAHVAVRHADLVGGAENEAVGVGEFLLNVGVEHLGRTAEQPVPVDRRATGRGRSFGRRAGDDAVEVGGPVVAGVTAGQPVAAELEAAARAAVRLQVAGNRERASDAAGDLGVLDGGEVVDLSHLEVRGGAVHDPVAGGGVAEGRQGVVSDVKLAGGDVLVGRDGEIPRQVQVRAPDARAAQCVEDRLEARPLGVDWGLARRELVAVVAESLRGRNRLSGGVLQVAQGDDVAVPGGEVDGRVDLEGGCPGAAGVGVDLNPDRLALARRRVDHDHRCVGVGVAADVVDRGCGCLLKGGRTVEARHLEDDSSTRAEAVVAEVGARIDRGAPGVLRASRRRGSRLVCQSPSMGGRPCSSRQGRAAGRGIPAAGR